MPIVKKLRLRLMRAIGMIIEDIILLISSAFLEIMLSFRPLLLLCSLFLQYIYTDNENIKSPHREVKPKMIKIRATKCKLKQMGPKYFSVSFSLSRL